MNTPSHAIANLAIFTKLPLPQANLAIVFGAVLPDLPIFLFYFWTKFILKLPEGKIWTEAYWHPSFQMIVAGFHSIPLALIGAAIARYLGWQIPQVIFISMVLHSLEDLPVHHDDAHRHFFPFTDYRFISPLSYWDPNHYGSIVALAELILVLFSTAIAFPVVHSGFGKAAILAIDGFYLAAYFYFYGRRLIVDS